MKLMFIDFWLKVFDGLPETKFVGQDWQFREWSWGIADKLWSLRQKEIANLDTKALEKELV